MEYDLVVEGKVVLPESVEEVQVGVDGGLIAEVRKQGLKGARTIRAGSCLVFPGFIDGHVHLREPGWEYKEDFSTGTAAAAHGGVTTVVDMPNNPKPATTVEALEEKRRLASTKKLVDVRFHGGVLKETLGELKEISGLVVGYKLYLAKSTGGLLFPVSQLGGAFADVAATGLPVSLHCEDQAIIESRERMFEGEDRADLHCDLRPPEAEVSSVESVISALRRAPGVRANVCHASTATSLWLIGQARKEGMSIVCEAALHHLFFSRKAMKSNGLLKTNPPLRREEDRVALIEGLRGGDVNFLVTDHAPHTVQEKADEGLSGVPGLDDYGHMVSWLMKSQRFETRTIARVCSSNPASFYGLRDRGEISVGKRADITVLDLKSPEKVSAETVMTKCGWSPYEGTEFPGKVKWTIVDGEIRLEDYELVG